MGDNLNGIFANMIQGMGFIGCAPNRVYNMAPPDGGGVEATAEGTDLSLHSAAAPLTALTLYGKSEQETTTGAQLINSQATGSFRGVDWTFDKGVATFSGTTVDAQTSRIYAYINVDDIVETGKTYYAKSFTDGIESDIRAETPNGLLTGTSYTPDGTETRIYVTAIVNNSQNMGIEVNLTAYIALTEDENMASWEPYTGGAPSPSPDYPQEIKSVGDSGTINVTLSDDGSQSQTLPVQTPNGLPGIPVDSGGNYTDASGQQWVCDEVDFERGVYVQRVRFLNAREAKWTDAWNTVFPDSSGNTHVFNSIFGAENSFSNRNAFCTHFKFGEFNNPEYGCDFFSTKQGAGDIGVRVSSDLASTIEEWNAYINSHDIIFVLVMKEENYVETPLSPSELSAYAALRTYSPTTVVSNDAGAWMRVGYKETPQPMTMLARKR